MEENKDPRNRPIHIWAPDLEKDVIEVNWKQKYFQ